MSTEEKNKTPWLNGYWYSESQTCFMYIVDGEYVDLKNMICIEYPEIKPMMKGTWVQFMCLFC